MIASVIFSSSIVCAIWGIYNYLDYRMEKREWKGKTKQTFETVKTRKSFIIILGERFDQTDYGKKLNLKLRKINLFLTPSEFCSMLIVGGMAVVMVLNKVFNFEFLMSVIFAVIAIIAISQLLFIIRRNKYQEKLNEQLSEVCGTLANATRSGMTINQGIQLVAREISEPARAEFQRLSDELSLGVDFEQALLSFQKRFHGRQFMLFVVTLITQKKAGGNIHETLEEMAHILDERKFLEHEINTLTSEQRFVSYIIPAIPIFLVLAINTIMEGYINVLFSGLGLILLIIFSIGTALSFFLVKKVTNIRV